MPNEAGATLQQPREICEREALRYTTTRRGKERRKTLETFALGFSTNEQQLEIRGINEVAQEFRPVRLGPVFSLTATAGMQRELVQGLALRVKEELGDVVSFENG
jgi:hypothetical protein